MTRHPATKPLLAGVMFAGIGLSAQAMVITFDGLPGTAMAGNSVVGGTFTGFASNVPATVGGFQFSSSGPEYFLGTAYTAACCNSDFGPLAYNGTDYLIGLPNISVSQIGGTAFALNGFDLVEWDNTFTASISLTTIGPLGTTTQILPLSLFSNNLITTGNDFSHFSLTGYGNVVSFTLTGNVNWAYIALDNLDTSAAIPEPTSLVLVGLGLAGLGFSRRKKT